MTEENTIIITKAEWKDDDTTELFGIAKTVKKPKEKTPGMKSVLITTDAYHALQKERQAISDFRPAVQLDELASAICKVYAKNPQFKALVQQDILDSRLTLLQEMQASLSPHIKKSDSELNKV